MASAIIVMAMMHEIELAGAGPDLRNAPAQSGRVREAAGIGEARRHARHEDEGLGGVGKAEIAAGEALVDRAGHVVDEDHHQGNAAEHVEPRIAPGDGATCVAAGRSVRPSGRRRA